MAHEKSESVSVLMVAIGGYGFHYLKALLEAVELGRCRISGVVDPLAEHSLLWPVVHHRKIPTYSTIQEFYADGHRADLAVISSPIHWHVTQSVVALTEGSAVLCDKPLGATIQEVGELVQARDSSGRWVMIGYQWSYSDAILALKRDILAGIFGRPHRLSALCFWPRDRGYYNRNGWAGRLRDPVTGRWVLDSPANNAMAHYLHNLFFLLGPEMDRSAQPRLVQAELNRAYPIESFDTVASRIFTSAGTELFFCASHATGRTLDPQFRLEFEDAVISYGENGSSIVALDRRGNAKPYGSPEESPQFRKLFAAIDHVRGRGTLVCGPEAAASQTLCINGMHESVQEISEFPSRMIRSEGSSEHSFVEGLDEELLLCYQTAVLPTERKAPWARAGREIDLEGYLRFPGGWK